MLVCWAGCQVFIFIGLFQFIFKKQNILRTHLTINSGSYSIMILQPYSLQKYVPYKKVALCALLVTYLLINVSSINRENLQIFWVLSTWLTWQYNQRWENINGTIYYALTRMMYCIQLSLIDLHNREKKQEIRFVCATLGKESPNYLELTILKLAKPECAELSQQFITWKIEISIYSMAYAHSSFGIQVLIDLPGIYLYQSWQRLTQLIRIPLKMSCHLSTFLIWEICYSTLWLCSFLASDLFKYIHFWRWMLPSGGAQMYMAFAYEFLRS